MRGPLPSDTLILSAISLTRRMPVRELRSKGWRTRAVDHATESLLNPATAPSDRVQHDHIDVLVGILLTFLTAGFLSPMWKRDVAKAFRHCPVRTDHLDLSWVVFRAFGVLWGAQHLGMPFGATSSVYAWHRVGNLLSWILLTVAKAPVGRYVDDFL